MFPEKYELRGRMNEEAMKYYAAAVCGLMAIFVLLHLTRVLARKTGLNKAAIFAPFHYASRFALNILYPAMRERDSELMACY